MKGWRFGSPHWSYPAPLQMKKSLTIFVVSSTCRNPTWKHSCSQSEEGENMLRLRHALHERCNEHCVTFWLRSWYAPIPAKYPFNHITVEINCPPTVLLQCPQKTTRQKCERLNVDLTTTEQCFSPTRGCDSHLVQGNELKIAVLRLQISFLQSRKSWIVNVCCHL